MNAVYSLIQFCPDVGRDEWFNVGLVVLCEGEWMNVQILDRGFGTNTPANHDFSHDPGLFLATLKGFSDRLIEEARDELDLLAFCASGGNPFRVSKPRQIIIHNDIVDIADMYERLVK